ncbi:PD40 domain-containing protein, partial [Oscillatoriales cyanobacterium LEGE 11467]|nr:PD40 domain-containing protein [Zarconia navalis LEGE 11467]
RDLNDLKVEIERLPLVLEILKKAGLVFFLPEVPHHRYQLVHDYLVPIIRARQELARVAENQALREQHKLLVQLAQAQQEKERAGARLKGALIAILTGTIASALVFSVLWQRATQLQKEAAIASIEALNAASQSLRLSDNRFEALAASVRAGKQFQELKGDRASGYLKSQTLNQLQLALYGIAERNRLENHTNSVLEVNFSRDGQWIATASADRTAKIWRPDGTLVQTVEHKNEVNSITFSPDSRTVATVSGDRVRLWPLNDPSQSIFISTGDSSIEGTQTRPPTRATSEYTATRVRFSPDGQLIATAHTDDNTVKLWKTDGTLVRTLEGHQNWVLDISFSPNGQTIASASLDETVKVWDIDGRNLATLPGHDCGRDTPCGVTSVDFSPDGTLIATASQDKTVKLWQPDGTFVRKLKNDAWVWDVSFSPDGRTLAIASRDNTVKLRTIEGEELQILRGHQKQVRSVSFSQDGQTIVSGSDDNTIVLWDRKGEEMPVLKGHGDRMSPDSLRDDDNSNASIVFAVSFSEDGKTIASGSADKTVKLWDRQGDLLQTLEGHQGAVNWVGWSRDGQTLASASEDGTLKLWRGDGTLAKTLNHGRGNPNGDEACRDEGAANCPGIESASFSADGRLIATAGGNTLKLWNRDGSRRQTFQLDGDEMAINSVAFAPDGQFLITGHDDRLVRLWNLQGEIVKTLRGHSGSVQWVTVSPDGEIVASASSDKTVKLWRLDGTEIATLAGHIAPVNWVSFSSDGKTLASASDAVKLWQLDEELDNPLLTTLEDDNTSVWSVSFSGDGKTLASSRADGTVVLWNLDFDDLLDRGCNWIEDYLRARDNRNICD